MSRGILSVSRSDDCVNWLGAETLLTEVVFRRYLIEDAVKRKEQLSHT